MSMLMFVYSFILALLFNLRFLSPDYISTLTNGSLALNSIINFSMFTENFQGVIFYSVDSYNNRIKVRVSFDNNAVKYIRIKYNDGYMDNYLYDICGCHQCKYQAMSMSIRLNNEKINVSCNDFKQSQTVSGQNINKNKTGYLATPMIVKNTTNNTYIMVGNIGPFIDDRGKSTFPDKNQLPGCVFYFKINQTFVYFTGSNEYQVGTKVQPRCIKQCVTKDICNEGQCLETYTHLVCVCNNTALNGPRCNNSLKTYIKGVNTSYTINKVDSQTYMKMTWRPSKGYSKEHCLLEFVNNGKYELIFVNKMMSASYGNATTNFVNVNITKDSIDYKMMNQAKSLKFPMPEKSRINIGFSERSGVCETFNGEYDFIYELSMLRLNEYIISSTLTYTDVTNDTSGFHTNKTDSISQLGDSPKIWIILIVIVATIIYIVMTAVCVIVNRRSNRFKEGVVQTSELIEVDEDDYSETDNPDYKDYSVVNGNVAYSAGQYTYSTYNQSASYSMNDVGPELPPRDEEKSEWIEIGTDYNSIPSSSKLNTYSKIDYQRTYIRFTDGEYAQVRQSVISAESEAPELPPRDE